MRPEHVALCPPAFEQDFRTILFDQLGWGLVLTSAASFREALGALPGARFAFAVKISPATRVLCMLAECGYGADIVSSGELKRALDVGMIASGIVFSGVCKTDPKLKQALDVGVGKFNLNLEEGEVSPAWPRLVVADVPVVVSMPMYLLCRWQALADLAPEEQQALLLFGDREVC